MVTVVLLVMRQRVRAAGHSLAGEGMLPRLRNASIALVATVTAVGLGLTLFIAQLGFPSVFSSPIPANRIEVGSVHDGVALTHRHAVAQSAPAHGGRSGAVNARHPREARSAGAGNGNGRGGGRGVRGSHQVAATPGTSPGSAGEHPVASIPVSAAPAPTAPPAEPAAPATAAVPATAESSPKASSDEHSKGTVAGVVKSSTPSSSKATSGGSGKSKGHQATKSDGHVAAVTKSGSGSAEKAGKDKSAAAAPKAPPPPPPTTKAPEAANPAATKEAADGGKSDRPHH